MYENFASVASLSENRQSIYAMEDINDHKQFYKGKQHVLNKVGYRQSIKHQMKAVVRSGDEEDLQRKGIPLI